MRTGFYPKLAMEGIRKNKRLYIPYLLTCIGVIAMLYIMIFLATTRLLMYLPGGQTIQYMLELGSWVIAVFAVLFLFYTHSFLIRRRKKEFGLYNILGMGKLNIGRIMIWETVIVGIFTLAVGLIAGITLSKLAELGLVRIVHSEAHYAYDISFQALAQTAAVFAVIYTLLLLNTLRQIHLSNPIALLRSENTGEKPPKANWLLGIAGTLILASAYYLAVTIEDPIAAMVWFFGAVIMVIVATYLLFTAGSVLLCRILQKNKKYYYKANHFVSVSSMAYRMKRNGAGLATICILATMVLVMISSCASLYFGLEDALRTRYPRNVVSDVYLTSLEMAEEENISLLRETAEEVTGEYDIEISNRMDYRYAQISGFLNDGKIEVDLRKLDSVGVGNYDKLYQIYFVPLSDYNQMMGTEEKLAEDEVLIYESEGEFSEDRLIMEGVGSYKIAGTVSDFVGNGKAAIDIASVLFVIVPDLQETAEPLLQLRDDRGNPMMTLNWYYGFDTTADEETQTAIANRLRESWTVYAAEGRIEADTYSVETIAENRDDLYGLYGGLFYLGILLSIVFVFAAVLIIYYKQISEGYEDQARFGIMRKVGMTKKDIRKSINSQMLTVFFLPIFMAVIHLTFAFPMICRLLRLFNVSNIALFRTTTVVCILIFAVFYALIYRMTSNAYFSIVSEAKEKTGK